MFVKHGVHLWRSQIEFVFKDDLYYKKFIVQSLSADVGEKHLADPREDVEESTWRFQKLP